MSGGTDSVQTALDTELTLLVHTLSGKTASLTTNSSAFLREVGATVEDLLGVPVGSQQWVKDEIPLLMDGDLTMAEIGLKSGTRITIMHCGIPTVVPLPEVFTLELTSVRHVINTSYSSAFTVLHKIRANVPEGWMSFEPWRKNDHDQHFYDIKAGTYQRNTCHWMAGSNVNESVLNPDLFNPLSDLTNSWPSPSKQISRPLEKFWLPVGSLPEAKSGVDKRCYGDEKSDSDCQGQPNYEALHGQFVAPSDDLHEIAVEISLPGGHKIIRLLIDSEGAPARAAVTGCKTGPMHQEIEEFLIQLKTCKDLARPVFEN